MNRIAIVILNWNGKSDTIECLSSIFLIKDQDFEVLLVDNGSTDGSVETISEKFPNTHIISTGKNLGFSGGNNVGIRWALGMNFDYILILNNDTVVDNKILSAFINASKKTEDLAVFGAKIYYYNKPDTLWFAGGRWRPDKLSFEHIGSGHKDGTEYSNYKECDYITGCALFASSNAFRTIGMLNDDFFLTYEETDWCYRAQSKGYKCIVVPQAKLWHKVSASFGGSSSPLITYFLTRNKLLWAKKHLETTSPRIVHEITRQMLRKIFPALSISPNAPFLKGFYWTLIDWLKTVRININMPHNRATLYGLRDYYLNRLGDCSHKIRSLNNK